MTDYEIDTLSRRWKGWWANPYVRDCDQGFSLPTEHEAQRTFWQLVALSEGCYAG